MKSAKTASTPHINWHDKKLPGVWFSIDISIYDMLDDIFMDAYKSELESLLGTPFRVILGSGLIN